MADSHPMQEMESLRAELLARFEAAATSTRWSGCASASSARRAASPG